MIENVSARIGNYIAYRAGFLEKADAVSYGCEIVIRSLIKIIIISLVSFLLGVFYETWTIIIFSALLRTFSGGIHCSTYANCLSSSTFVFTTLGMLVKIVAPYLTPSNTTVFLILTTSVLYCIWFLWIPAGSDNRPLTKKTDKKKFKIYSSIVIGLHFCASFSGLAYFRTPKVTLLVFSSIIGLLWQGFTISPFGYHAIAKFDNVLKNMKNPLCQ